jgi:hypothetical protein
MWIVLKQLGFGLALGKFGKNQLDSDPGVTGNEG